MPEVDHAHPRRREGFTLVEVIVAIVIIGITSVTFIALSLTSYRELQLSSDYYRAVSLARNRIERIRIMDYDTILNLSEAEHRVDGNGNADAEGAYRRETEVTPLTANLVEVTVTVSFPDRPSRLVADPVVVHTRHARWM